jgi:hypothetical protein
MSNPVPVKCGCRHSITIIPALHDLSGMMHDGVMLPCFFLHFLDFLFANKVVRNHGYPAQDAAQCKCMLDL